MMRKKTIKNLFDTIFWYIIYLLPIIFLVLAWFKGNTDYTLNTIFFANSEFSIGFGLFEENIIIIGLVRLFGPNGVFPLFVEPGFLAYLAYFVNCWVIHLAVDVLLFIVRWSHSMIDGFLGGKYD